MATSQLYCMAEKISNVISCIVLGTILHLVKIQSIIAAEEQNV
jgi:hypothetical protein